MRWKVPSSTELTSSSRATWAGSAAEFAYFKTELVGRTARFFSEASRLIIASAMPIDRKSTRLNSSHDQISYAVFCLKKKKNRRWTITREDNIAGGVMYIE